MRRRRFRPHILKPEIVDRFLNRKLDNFDWLKEAPREELVRHIRNDLGHRFVNEPWHNQLACFTIAANEPHFLFFLKMGGGKTSIALQQIRHRKRLGHLGRALVLAPYLLHVDSWEDQIKQDAPDLKYRLLVGDRDERKLLAQKKSDLCVMNYKGLEVYMAHMAENKKKKRREMQVNEIPASEFATLFNFVVFDEGHRLGNRQSLLYEMCRYLSVACDFRYLLTGTPFGRDPEKLWSQFMLVDHGETLGATLGIFRNAFFEPKKHYFKGVEWVFDKDRVEDLSRTIKHRSITYELNELQDVPRKTRIRLPVRLAGEGAAYYRRIVDNIKETRGDYRSLDNIFTRLRQCCSGFIAMRADDASRIEVQFKTNPKLERLREFILTKEDEKILVYHDFIPSAHIIGRMLEEIKVPFASLRGGQKDAGEQYRRFLDDRNCRIFVLNNQLGSECINPQYVSRRIVFYESNPDPIIRAQAEGRIERGGQKQYSFVHDLIVKGSIEEKILSYAFEGESLLKAVLAGDDEALAALEDFDDE